MKEKIAQLKFKSRLSWRELADEIGVQPNTLHLWGKGYVQNIKPENEFKLNQAFKKHGVEVGTR